MIGQGHLRGSGIVDEHDGWFGGVGADQPCSICQGDVSDEFVAIVEQAAAYPGRVMSLDEVEVWLRAL
jgi:hypothetical protein